MNPRSRHHLLVVLALLLVGLFLFPQTSAAQTKDYFWESFNVEITVLENGDLRVEEEQTLVFSGEPFTYGYRNIPINDAGRNDGLRDIGVREGVTIFREDSSQAPNTFRVSTSKDETTVYWYFAPATGQHVYTFSYTVAGGIRTEPGGDQVYWNAMPADLGKTIRAGQITITLPEGIRAESTTASVAGRENDGITTQVSEDGRQVVFTLTEPRPAGSDVEVGVRFPTGQLALTTPEWQQNEQVADVQALLILLFSIFVAVVGPLLVLLLWYLVGRDPQVGTAVPDYLAEPPSNLPPAVVGTLIDEKAQIQDVMSTLIDLARRGYMTMTETKSGRDFVFSKTDITPTDLRPYERAIMDGVFGRKSSRRLNDLKYNFSSKLPGIRKQLYEELRTAGYVRSSPESTRNNYGCLGILILTLAGGSFWLASVFLSDSVATALCPAFAFGLTGLVMLATAQFMPAKTALGAEEAAKWSAFKTYLQDIEKYADLQQATAIFEQYLAYAVAFGLERSWIRKFSQVPNTPVPHWYAPVILAHSPGRGHQGSMGSAGAGGPSLEGMSRGMTGGLESMSSGLTRMLTSTQSVLVSTRSSSSSGGGGFSGGFSGGSSGGGGGGFG